MKKLSLTLSGIIASVLGVVGGQANAKVNSEEELFRATIDTGTLEAAEVFKKQFPDSNHSNEINSLISDLVRSDYLESGFEGKGEHVVVAKRNGKAKGHSKARGNGHGAGKPGKRKGHHKHGGGY